MVTIRLTRGGAKKAPFYQVVVTDSRNRRDGRCIERVGYFNPTARGQAVELELNSSRIDYWLSHGARPSDRVADLLKRYRRNAAAVEASATDSAPEQSAGSGEAAAA